VTPACSPVQIPCTGEHGFIGMSNRSRSVRGRLAGTFRRAAGLTQTALADAASVDEETIASVEQGRL
jgi:hypothetical protein